MSQERCFYTEAQIICVVDWNLHHHYRTEMTEMNSLPTKFFLWGKYSWKCSPVVETPSYLIQLVRLVWSNAWYLVWRIREISAVSNLCLPGQHSLSLSYLWVTAVITLQSEGGDKQEQDLEVSSSTIKNFQYPMSKKYRNTIHWKTSNIISYFIFGKCT